jgi:hypothetical protein
MSLSGDARFFASRCSFLLSKTEGADGGTCTGILSQYVPVHAEHCTFVSSCSDDGYWLEGMQLQGSSHALISCDWSRCRLGVALSDEASVQLTGCSWANCEVGLQAASKAKTEIIACVLLRNFAAVVLEEGAGARISTCQFVLNTMTVAARSGWMQLRSSCCVFDGVAFIFDSRSSAQLSDSSFIGAGLHDASTASCNEDVLWLQDKAVALSAAAVSASVDCMLHAHELRQRRNDEDTAALHVVCAVKAVSSVSW